MRANDLILPEDPSLASRFWKKVLKTPTCWLWTAKRDSLGYGRFRVKGVLMMAHRVSYALSNGSILGSGTYILHKCDNPPCVRSDHLFAGSNRDNIMDAIGKGRLHFKPNRGEQNGWSKLSWEQVRRIRSDYVPYRVLQNDLAKQYGVSMFTVRSILAGRTWPDCGYQRRFRWGNPP